MPDDISPCPFCSHDTVELHYARHDGGDWPGCTNCEETRPLEEWTKLVAEKR